jgi:hypothetical protein
VFEPGIEVRRAGDRHARGGDRSARSRGSNGSRRGSRCAEAGIERFEEGNPSAVRQKPSILPICKGSGAGSCAFATLCARGSRDHIARGLPGGTRFLGHLVLGRDAEVEGGLHEEDDACRGSPPTPRTEAGPRRAGSQDGRARGAHGHGWDARSRAVHKCWADSRRPRKTAGNWGETAGGEPFVDSSSARGAVRARSSLRTGSSRFASGTPKRPDRWRGRFRLSQALGPLLLPQAGSSLRSVVASLQRGARASRPSVGTRGRLVAALHKSLAEGSSLPSISPSLVRRASTSLQAIGHLARSCITA